MFRTLMAYLPAFEFELWTGDSTAHEQNYSQQNNFAP